MGTSLNLLTPSWLRLSPAEMCGEIQAGLHRRAAPRLCNTSIQRTRLAGVGCKQQHGMNYYETYAPIPRLESGRALLSLTATTESEYVSLSEGSKTTL